MLINYPSVVQQETGPSLPNSLVIVITGVKCIYFTREFIERRLLITVENDSIIPTSLT